MNKNNKNRKRNTRNRIKSNRKVWKCIEKQYKSNFITNLIGHILTIIGLLLAFIEIMKVIDQYNLNIDQYNLNIEQYNLNIERQKKANSIKYLQTLHELLNNTDESLLEIIKYYDMNNDGISIISYDSLEIILQENHTYRKQLEDIMIGFNQLAIGCQEGFFDEMTVWTANSRMVVNVTKALIPFYELIEKEKGYGENQFVCAFLRIMAFRWEHDWTMGKKYNKMIIQLEEETRRATNDSMPIIRRMPVVNE